MKILVDFWLKDKEYNNSQSKSAEITEDDIQAMILQKVGEEYDLEKVELDRFSFLVDFN